MGFKFTVISPVSTEAGNMPSWKILMRNIPPENPTISEPTLRSIPMVPGEVNVECNSLIDVYRVELKNTIYEDIKSTSGLMRRMSTLKTYPQLEATRTYKLTGHNLKEQLKVASRLLGIEDCHIITIKRIEHDLFTSIPKPYNLCNNFNSTSKTTSRLYYQQQRKTNPS